MFLLGKRPETAPESLGWDIYVRDEGGGMGTMTVFGDFCIHIMCAFIYYKICKGDELRI